MRSALGLRAPPIAEPPPDEDVAELASAEPVLRELLDIPELPMVPDPDAPVPDAPVPPDIPELLEVPLVEVPLPDAPLPDVPLPDIPLPLPDIPLPEDVLPGLRVVLESVLEPVPDAPELIPLPAAPVLELEEPPDDPPVCAIGAVHQTAATRAPNASTL